MQFLTLSAENTEIFNLFPFPFKFHLVVVIISFIFFAVSFIRYKKPYQLIFAIAVPLSLLIWKVGDNKSMFYIIGAIEFALILIAFITAIIFRPKKNDGSEG